mmetsp:Transcript_117790/g.345055  ORF Transcript_117790/g.345055 Transcript_117790/m.345055 type:complete len:426 (-) Transcript_117790:175-1452(-)
MPPLGADFARSAAGRLGVQLGDAAAAELAVHLELHLRKVLGLALKLARRARRRRLCSADVADATECNGAGLPPWASGLMQYSALEASLSRGKLTGGSVVPLPLEYSRKLGKSPLELSLSVEWLAVEGAAVGLGGGGMLPGPGMRPIEVLEPGGPVDSVGMVLASAPSFLAEEQVSLLTRIVKVLSGGEELARWHGPVVAACRREECMPLLPFLAQYVACRVPACLADAPPPELRLLLDVLDAVALAPRGAEPLLHQCLPPALLLCLSPALGSGRRALRGPGEGVAYHSVRRKAAAVVARIALRYCEALPEVYSEVFRIYEEALRRSPPIGVAAGAALGLAALGPRCATQVLTPALMEGLALHLAAATHSPGQNAADAGAAATGGAGERGEPQAKKAKATDGMALFFHEALPRNAFALTTTFLLGL